MRKFGLNLNTKTMKTTISTVAAIAVAFAGLAFMPAQKNNALDEAVAATVQKDEADEVAACDYKYKTETEFSECLTRSVHPADAEEQAEVLDKY